VIIGSLGLHGAALTMAAVAPLTRALAATRKPGAEPLPADAPEAKLDPSCEANVVLAFSARSLYCSGPFAGEGDACLDAALEQLSVGFEACRAVVLGENPVEVALLDPAKIEEIEAEPLIETLDPVEQKKFEQQQEQKREEMAEQLQKKEEQRPDPSAQVVEMAKPQVEVAPDQARFLSEYDNKVEKQTVARGSRFEEIIAKPKPAELTPTPDPQESAVKELRPDLPLGSRPDAPPVPGALRMRTPGASGAFQAAEQPRTAGPVDGTRAPASDNGIAPRRGEGAVTTQGHDPVETPRGQGGAGGGQAPVPELKSKEILERIAGGGSVDHLDDVDEGDETALSSKRWKFAGFFNRLKRQVSQNWDPASVYQRRDPSGRVYGTRTRITQVRVSLDPSGNLESIYVVKGSGVDFLDEEAIRAFRAAQPFPNPPAGLLGGDKMITFVFGFYFEIGERPVWKIYRAQ
jgi:TonB family protein